MADLHSIHLIDKLRFVFLVIGEYESEASLHVNSLDIETLLVKQLCEVVGGDGIC